MNNSSCCRSSRGSKSKPYSKQKSSRMFRKALFFDDWLAYTNQYSAY